MKLNYETRIALFAWFTVFLGMVAGGALVVAFDQVATFNNSCLDNGVMLRECWSHQFLNKE
jgi:hypothetical protein